VVTFIVLSIPRKWGHLVSRDFQKKKNHADPATRALNRTRFTDHSRPPPFLASSNTLHPSRPIFCCIRDQTPPPTSPKSSPPLRFVWCSILGKSTCKTIMDNDSDPPFNLEPSLAPPPPSFMCPIGHEIMRDPVSCADGHSYEQANIKRWLVSNSTSPLTGAVLPT
jgi:hypothetical protein